MRVRKSDLLREMLVIGRSVRNRPHFWREVKSGLNRMHPLDLAIISEITVIATDDMVLRPYSSKTNPKFALYEPKAQSVIVGRKSDGRINHAVAGWTLRAVAEPYSARRGGLIESEEFWHVHNQDTHDLSDAKLMYIVRQLISGEIQHQIPEINSVSSDPNGQIHEILKNYLPGNRNYLRNAYTQAFAILHGANTFKPRGFSFLFEVSDSNEPVDYQILPYTAAGSHDFESDNTDKKIQEVTLQTLEIVFCLCFPTVMDFVKKHLYNPTPEGQFEIVQRRDERELPDDPD